MKNSFILAAIALLGVSCSIKHPPKKIFPHEKHRIDRLVNEIIKETDPNVNIGIRIQSLKSNSVVFEKNANRHFMPGSTIKILTLASALHYLGPSYRFYTYLKTDGPVSADGTIKDLYIQGSGDPSLMDYDLIRLVEELSQRGIKKITGKIYIDDQIFDDVIWAQGDIWDDRNRGYAAPVCGLNLNYNRILIKTVPGFNKGSTATAVVQPMTRFVQVVSNATTSESGKNLSLLIERGKSRAREWPANANDGLRLNDRIIVNGQMGANAEPHYSLLAVNDPSMLAATFVKEEMMRRGIKFTGTIERKAVPAQARILARHESRSLAEALIDFTKISNNVANDALVKAIAANAGAKPASFAAGLKLITAFLEKEVGFLPESLVAADGAGLSRYNLVTPEQMVKVLDYAANHFRMGPEFIAALPIVGGDGNLRTRLGDQSHGQIRAKSGTMTGMTSLAGYLIDDDGERYVFAIMINGFVGRSAKYISLQDKILTAMLHNDQTQLANVK